MTGGHGDIRQIDERPHYHAMCACGDVNAFCTIADGVDDVHARHARGAAPGRALHQDHGLGRRGLAHRSHLDEPVSRGRDPRDRQRVHRAPHVRRGALPPGERGAALRRIRRALDRARHADRRRDRALRRLARRLHRADDGDHLRAGRARARSSAFRPQSQEKAEYAFTQAISGMDSMRRAGVKIGFGTDLLGSTYVQAVPRVHASAARCSRRSRSCARRPRSTPS